MNLTNHLYMIPIIKGITEVQRKGKKAFSELFDGKKNSDVIYLADRNKIFAVVLSVEKYEKVTQPKISEENRFWLKSTENSLHFWEDSSNDIYEKLL